MEEPVIFSTVVEGTKKAFGERLTPALLAKLKAAGMDFNSGQPAYPMDAFLRAFQVLADELVPDEPDANRRYRRLGHDFMAGYVETGLGRATLMMAKLIGLRRALERLGRNMYTTGNYLTVEVINESPTGLLAITRVRPVFHPFVTDAWGVIAQYRLGIFDAVFELLGTPGTIELLEDSKFETRFRLQWEAKR